MINCVICKEPFDEVSLSGGRYYVCADCRESEERKEQAVAKGEIPAFKDFDEMQKWLKDQETSPTKPKAKSKKSGTKVPENEVTKEVERPDLIWQAQHFYQRTMDSFQNVIKDAKLAKERANEHNTIIFVHDHEFRTACSNSCKEV